MKFNERIHKELNKAFNLIKDKYYGVELPKVNILVHTIQRKNVLGYCTVDKVWDISNEKYYEIVLSAENLNRPFEEIITTLMHEMVHLYNLANDVKDTSGTQYHNKRFKNEAEKRGLVIEYAPIIGWSPTTLSEEAKEWLATIDIDREVFNAVRNTRQAVKKKQPKNYTFTCPQCNEKIISKNLDVHVICGDCGVEFER